MSSYNKVAVHIQLLSFCLSIIFFVSPIAEAKQKDAIKEQNELPLIIGIFPRRNASTTIKLFTPLAQHIAKKLGREVKLETAKDFRSFWQKVLLQRYDIVHFNQYHYIKMHDKNKYRAILQNEEFGKRTIAGSIMVHKDSGINSLQDLKNKKIIFGGGKKAMMAYVVPTALLHRSGLKKGSYIEQFSKNPPNSILSIYYKQADAAGAGNSILNLPVLHESINTSKIKILASSKPLSHLPWAIKTSISKKLGSQIQNIMLELNNSNKGKEILKKAKLTGLHIANGHDYNRFRKILIEVFGKNY